MSIDLSDGSFDPVMDDAEAEASEIIKVVSNMTVEQYAQMREALLASASHLNDLRGGWQR